MKCANLMALDTLGARFEVLRVYFIARFLAKGLQKLYRATPEKDIARTLARNAIGQSQVAEWLAWQLRKLSYDRLRAAIRHAYEIIDMPANASDKNRAAVALSHLISQLIPEESKSERRLALLKLMTESQGDHVSAVRRLTFAGKLRAFDFSGLLFEGCVFVDVDFSGCTFSAATAFRNCIFEGSLDFNGCEGAVEIELVDPRLSSEAELAVSKIQSRKASKAVRELFAEEALVRALRKFRGDPGFHSIQVRRRQNGTNPKNPFNNIVWASLKRNNIIGEHDISGVAEGGYHVLEDKDVRRELVQYLDNGIVGARLKVVLSEMIN